MKTKFDIFTKNFYETCDFDKSLDEQSEENKMYQRELSKILLEQFKDKMYKQVYLVNMKMMRKPRNPFTDCINEEVLNDPEKREKIEKILNKK